MTWTSFHRRGETLRNVIAAADRHLDGRIPMHLDGVAEKFADELDLLSALQLRWHTQLAGRIEQELMEQPMDLEAAVVSAWHGAAQSMPGIRAILDRHSAAPHDAAMAAAMRKAVAKEHVLLAVMAGHAGLADHLAAGVGARIEERARAERPAVALDPDPAERPTLLERLKAALAA